MVAVLVVCKKPTAVVNQLPSVFVEKKHLRLL